MIENIFRFFALVLLLAFVVIKDIKAPAWTKHPQLQLYVAILIVFIIIFIDNVFGFILGLAVLVLYFKIYNKELKEKKESKKVSQPEKMTVRCPLEMENKEVFVGEKGMYQHHSDHAEHPDTSLIDFVSTEHLISAQNNIVDVNNYNKEIIGVDKGLYNEQVYGSQGINSNNTHIQGMDFSVVHLGSLTYSTIV